MTRREGGLEPFQDHDTARCHTRQPAFQDAVLDGREPLAQDLDEADRLILRFRERPDRGDGVQDALHALGRQADDHGVDAQPLGGPPHVIRGHRAHLAQPLGEDQVRCRGGQCVEIQVMG